MEKQFAQQHQQVANQVNVAGDATIQNVVPLPSARLHSIPSPKADFTGREKELAQLREMAKTGTAAICALHGLGGVGKTELAYKLTEELAPQYPDAQLLIRLGGTSDDPLTPATALTRLIQNLEPNASNLSEDLESLQNIYRSLLHGKRAILLADNASGAEQVQALIPPSSCLLLVTSRLRFLVGGSSPLRLGCLEASEAVELLLRICPRIGEQAPALAELCGCLPLALRAAASYLVVNDDVSPSRYTEQLSDETKRLQKLKTEGVEISVEASLNLSYGKLDQATSRVVRLLSIFAGTFDATAEQTICQDEDSEHLRTLRRYSLVEFDGNSERYRLHDLVRIFATAHLATPEHIADEIAARERHAAYYRDVLAGCDDLYLQGGDVVAASLALFDLERRNIEAGQHWAAAHLSDSSAMAELTSSYPDAGVYVLSLRLHSRQWIGWLEVALAASRRLGKRWAEGNALGNLGIAYKNLGEVRRAIEFHEQALEIDREIGDRRGEGVDLFNTALALRQLGETKEAIPLAEEALSIFIEIEDPKVAMVEQALVQWRTEL